MLWMVTATETFGELETLSKFAVEADDEAEARMQALRNLAEWRGDGTREDEWAFSFLGFETMVELEYVEPIPDEAAAYAWIRGRLLQPSFVTGALPDEGRGYDLDEARPGGFRYDDERAAR